MSYYDPFRLYYRSQAKSHKGQVLRKKYYPYQGLTLSDDDIKRVIDTLTHLNYTIIPPGQSLPPPPLPPPEPIYHGQDLVYILSTGEFAFTPDIRGYSVHFSTLWDAVYNSFSAQLQADPSQITDFVFSVDLISLTLRER